MQFDRHTLVLLVRRPDAPELTDEEAAELQDRHLAFRADLRDRGYLIGGGPLVDQDDERLRGISIMMCDPETARRLSNEDPAVRAGRLAVEVMTWMVLAATSASRTCSRRGRWPRRRRTEDPLLGIERLVPVTPRARDRVRRRSRARPRPRRRGTPPPAS